MKNVIPVMGVVAFAALAARADIVTNAETLVISSPTTFSGVTNIYTHTTLPAQIDADLTLDNCSYLRFMGANLTGTSTSPTDTKPVIKIGTAANDVTLTVKGNSMFATTYRNSTSGAAWVNTKIDPAGNSKAAPSRIRVHLGTPDGEAGSTGQVKIDVVTKPSFGDNTFGGFWAEWLYINTSVKPNDSGYIDFLDIGSGATADISFIDNLNDTPARILFSDGTLMRNNAISHDAPLAVSTDHELILEGKDGKYVQYLKQYSVCDFTARRGGTVRFRGSEVRLCSRGQHIAAGDFNFVKWNLSANDHVVWEQTGQLYLRENCFLSLASDDLLPHAAANGQIRFHYNSGNSGKPFYVNYCALDIGGTVQHVNGMVSDNQTAPMIGVVTNDAYACGTATARGTLVFGEHDLSTVFNAYCTTGVDVKKIGTGRLTVRNASGESLTLAEGSAAISNGSAFDTFAVSNEVEVLGTVNVGELATLEAKANVLSLNMELAENAKIFAAGTQVVNLLKVGDTEVAAGTYTTADWLAEGSAAVTVFWDSKQPASDVTWTGNGEDTKVGTADNWDDATKVVLEKPFAKAKFATGGSEALFPAGNSYLNSLTFNAAGNFTLSGADATSQLTLYEDLMLEEGSGTRAYTVDLPLKLMGDSKTITVPNSDVTLNLRDLSGSREIEILGTKLSTLAYDYSTNGVIVLENPRTDGNINHEKGGGTVILRGEVGVENDCGTYTLDYGHYRNNSSKDSGWCESGKTRMENVVFRKKVQINGAGLLEGGTGTSNFLVLGGETNVFKELVQEYPSAVVVGERGTVNIFEKGFKNTNGSCEFAGESRAPMATTAAEPTTFIFNGPVQADNTNRQLQFTTWHVKAIFRSTGNYAKMYMSLYNNSKLEFTVDDAFTDTDFYFVGNSEVNLCGTHQKARNLMSYGKNDLIANYGTIKSDKPATFEVTGGAPSREACAWVTEGDSFHLGVSTNSTQQFSGPVSLVKSGSGYLLMNRNGSVASTGSVTVKGGTLEFAARTSWPAAGEVAAEKTGALVLNKNDTFDRDVKLTLADSGTLALPSDVVMRVGELWLDDAARPARPGVYGAVGDEGAKYTTSHILSGRVKVPNLGTRIIIR